MKPLAMIADAWKGIKLGRAMRAEPPAESRSVSGLSQPGAWLLHAFGSSTKSGANVSPELAFNVSAVRACVGLRASLIATLPLKLYQRTAAGPVEQRDHPLARLLRGKVAPGQTSYKWRASSQVCLDLGGNAFSLVARNGYAEPVALRWLRPSSVTPLEDRATGAIGWRISGSERALLEHEVLHVANLSSDGRMGRSPLSDLREAVGLALTAEEFTARTFANGNRKPGVLEGGPAMTKTKAEEFQRFWFEHYAGAANAGKSPFIWGGVSWKDAGFSAQDAELLGQRRFEIEEIARVYQIPLHLIGSTEKATTWGSGIEQLNQGLVDYMLAPLCANWEAELKTTLLTEQEQAEDYFIKFNVDALLRGSPETRAKVYQIMRGIRAMSVNEIRRLEELSEAFDNGANNLDWALNGQGSLGGAPGGPPEVRVAPGDVHVTMPTINVDVHVPKPTGTRAIRDDRGRLIGTEPRG